MHAFLKESEVRVNWIAMDSSTLICSDAGKSKQVPDFVFLAHAIDVISCMHAPFVSRSCGSKPYVVEVFMLLLWPLAFLVMLLMWAWSKTFLLTFYNLRGRLHQTWIVPRFGFQVVIGLFVLPSY